MNQSLRQVQRASAAVQSFFSKNKGIYTEADCENEANIIISCL